jgi:hypothetical protein
VSVVVLALGVVLAASRGDASYTRDEVVQAFAQEGYALAELDGGGWTGYAPFADRAEGTFLFPGSQGQGPFYVFVARNDMLARQFFAPLAAAGGGPRVFDLLRGNVVVSSDASLSDTGLTSDERRRISAAMERLDETS